MNAVASTPTARPRAQAPIAVLTTLALTIAGCAGGDGDASGGSDLVVERSTEGNVTTVRNVSGSTWGEPAGLVEELSIGVLEGDEPYMLGRVNSLWATDELLYVLDSQAPALRVYDLEGNHLRDIGGQGQGPGEFERPFGLAVFPDGSAAIHDGGSGRLVFWDAAGEPVRTWRPESGFVLGFHALRDGSLLVRYTPPPEERATGARVITSAEGGVAPLLDDGTLGDLRTPPDFGFVQEPFVVQVGGGVFAIGGSILFSPSVEWTVAPDGSIVAGLSDNYRVERHATDGAVMAIERFWTPVPVHPDEATYAVRLLESQFRGAAPDWTYDGDPPAATKPAFQGLNVDRDGRLWVVRAGEARRADDCIEDPRDDPQEARRNPCWISPTLVDAFAPDGSYLGELRRPEGLTFRAVFARGDTYWAAVEDEDGLVTVKRFRLVTPDST